MDHVERASVPAFCRKKRLQIWISRSILGVRQKIEYLGPPTHRGGSNDAIRFWFRNATTHFLDSIQYFPIKNHDSSETVFSLIFYRKILNTIKKMGCSIPKPKSDGTIRTASMRRWT